MDAESLVMEWPDDLVKILESDIEIAQSVNDRSWSIFTYEKRPVFGVSNNTLLYFDPVSGNASIRVDEAELSIDSIEWLKKHDGGISGSLRLPKAHISELPQEVISAHHTLVKRLAVYRSNRWTSFRLDFHQAFSEQLGAKLPLPGYIEDWRANRIRQAERGAPDKKYDSSNADPTGYWLWTVENHKTPEIYNRAISEGTILFQYDGVSIDVSELPSDRTSFVKQAKTLQSAGVKAGVANRYWLFAYGVEIGDWIVLKSDKPAIGQITGEYQHTDVGDIREVEWHWISDEPVRGDVFSKALEGRNLWGFTTLEPIEFKRLLAALGQPDLVDMSHVTEPAERSLPSAETGVSTFHPPQIGEYFASHGLNYSNAQLADFYTALQTKGFVVLSGISGTGKSKIATGFTQLLPDPDESDVPQVDGENTRNTLFLSVRPDWRDSTSLLGYYNPLTQTYEWTRFLQFILDAAKNYQSDDPIAWFVILDEMNLAHVEYYFADLLSVLESGRVTNPSAPNFGFTSQPLRLTYPDNVQNDPPPTEVHLPPNLYIIGTVNMDETTHAFSPKVLDRAFSMELTEVDFTDYPRNQDTDIKIELAHAAKREFLQSFSQNGKYPQIRKDEIQEYVRRHETVRRSLQALNAALAEYRFHFGYRVFDEIVQFLVNAESNELYGNSLEAFDSAVFMKVLPKFSGSEARVGEPLQALIAWASNPFRSVEQAEPLRRSLARAKYMARILEANGFVTAF